MGLTTGNFPPVQPADFMRQPYRDRTKVLGRHWVDYGFGAYLGKSEKFDRAIAEFAER
jgi:hypothetical protein